MSINRQNIEVQSGTFSTWQENFDRQEEFERARSETLMKDIGRLQDAARRTANWSEWC